jgi:hypothetical protein
MIYIFFWNLFSHFSLWEKVPDRADEGLPAAESFAVLSGVKALIRRFAPPSPEGGRVM